MRHAGVESKEEPACGVILCRSCGRRREEDKRFPQATGVETLRRSPVQVLADPALVIFEYPEHAGKYLQRLLRTDRGGAGALELYDQRGAWR